jgi:hypothetical protein
VQNLCLPIVSMFLEGGDQGRGQQQAGRGQGREGVFGHLINLCACFVTPSLVFVWCCAQKEEVKKVEQKAEVKTVEKVWPLNSYVNLVLCHLHDLCSIVESGA